METVVGLFETRDEAESAVRDLVADGFSRDDITVVSNATVEGGTTTVIDEAPDQDESDVAENVLLSGAVGAAVGVISVFIPGVGPVIAAGPLLAGLVGAGVGAVTGGLASVLAETEIPEVDRHYYAEGVRRGGTLVVLTTEDEDVARVLDALNNNGALDIEERAASWRATGWESHDAAAEPYSAEQIHAERTARRSAIYNATTEEIAMSDDLNNIDDSTLYEPVDENAPPITDGVPLVALTNSEMSVTGAENVPEGVEPIDMTLPPTVDTTEEPYLTHFDENYFSGGYTYDEVAPAYALGEQLARENAATDWQSIEDHAHKEWELRSPTTWDDFKEAIEYGWSRAKGLT